MSLFNALDGDLPFPRAPKFTLLSWHITSLLEWPTRFNKLRLALHSCKLICSTCRKVYCMMVFQTSPSESWTAHNGEPPLALPSLVTKFPKNSSSRGFIMSERTPLLFPKHWGFTKGDLSRCRIQWTEIFEGLGTMLQQTLVSKQQISKVPAKTRTICPCLGSSRTLQFHMTEIAMASLTKLFHGTKIGKQPRGFLKPTIKPTPIKKNLETT